MPAKNAAQRPNKPSQPGSEKEKGLRVLTAEFVAAATSVDDLPAPSIGEVAFAGRSNVGKSSLLNLLMQRRSLARTSSTPGCTRQIVTFDVRVEGELSALFVDLPGYGYAKRSKAEKQTWGKMIEQYLVSRPTLRALVLLVDVRRGLLPDDRELLAFIREGRERSRQGSCKALVVATKLDKLGTNERASALAAIRREKGVRVVGVSAHTGEGREALLRDISAALRGDDDPARGANAGEAGS